MKNPIFRFFKIICFLFLIALFASFIYMFSIEYIFISILNYFYGHGKNNWSNATSFLTSTVPINAIELATIFTLLALLIIKKSFITGNAITNKKLIHIFKIYLIATPVFVIGIIALSYLFALAFISLDSLTGINLILLVLSNFALPILWIILGFVYYKKWNARLASEITLTTNINEI